MKSAKLQLAASLVVGAVGAGSVRAAGAAVFSSIDLEQDVFYLPPRGGGPQVATPVVTQVTPFSSTVSLNSGTGAMVAASYNVYDNGSSAGISITDTANITALGNGVGEATQAVNYSARSTTFSFNQPVVCTQIVSGTGTGDADTSIELYGAPNNFAFGYGYGSYYNTQSAILNAGFTYSLVEYISISNNTTGANEPASLSANESLILTFTPVPEPSSAVLLPILAVAARRRPRLRRATCTRGSVG